MKLQVVIYHGCSTTQAAANANHSNLLFLYTLFYCISPRIKLMVKICIVKVHQSTKGKSNCFHSIFNITLYWAGKMSHDSCIKDHMLGLFVTLHRLSQSGACI